MNEFSQKEEDTFRKDLFKRMDGQDIVLKEIKEQTTKTNGRVTTLEVRTEDYAEFEKIVSGLSGWKMWIMGSVGVIIVGGGFVWNLVLTNILNTAEKNTQKIIEKQKAQLIKDVITEIDQTYNLQLIPSN